MRYSTDASCSGVIVCIRAPGLRIDATDDAYVQAEVQALQFTRAGGDSGGVPADLDEAACADDIVEKAGEGGLHGMDDIEDLDAYPRVGWVPA